MRLNSRFAAAVYVVAVALASVAALEAGKTFAACSISQCPDIGGTTVQFSDGTIFYRGTGSFSTCLRFMKSNSGLGYTGCIGTGSPPYVPVDKYSFGTPSCSESIGTWVTATGVTGSTGTTVNVPCCASCN